MVGSNRLLWRFLCSFRKFPFIFKLKIPPLTSHTTIKTIIPQTISLMFFAAFVQTFFVIGPWKGYLSPHLALYLILVVLSAIAHTKCQFTNPGCVPRLLESVTYPSPFKKHTNYKCIIKHNITGYQ